MTIAILKQEPGQKVPRPFARASNVFELGELLVDWWRRNVRDGRPVEARFSAIDTEEPIVEHRGTRFFAFREEN
jgi:hypothetical protein